MNSNFITETEKLSRQKSVQFAIDNNRLEGLDTDKEILELSQEWVNGVISYSEFQEKVYEIYGLGSVSYTHL
ncbi:antitoxin VbhA family protein, partial [Haemophilus haemolyticus]|uniref:antitoxin VbhA family protein n=1 Tax=Haemophilus haemolyticus TaxID=726 RepID=UPI00112C8383